MKEFDDCQSDPVSVPFHDVDFHGSQACTYLPYEHSLIFKYVIPILNELKEEFPSESEFINSTIKDFNEFSTRNYLASKQDRIRSIIHSGIRVFNYNTTMVTRKAVYKSYLDKVTALKSEIFRDCGVTIDYFRREISLNLGQDISFTSSRFSAPQVFVEKPKDDKQVATENMQMGQML